MLGKAYIKDKKVYLYFSENDVGKLEGFSYDLGFQLTNLLRLDLKIIEQKYLDYIDYSLFSNDDNNNDLKYAYKVGDMMKDIDFFCPYLHYYTQALYNFICDYYRVESDAFTSLLEKCTDTTYTMQSINQLVTARLKSQIPKNEIGLKIMFEEMGCVGISEEKKVHISCKVAIDILIEDIKQKQKRISDELDFIIDNSNSFKNLNGMRKLYLLDYKRKLYGKSPYYTDICFSSQYSPDCFIPNEIQDIETLKNIIISQDVDIVEMYNISDVNVWIRFELINLIIQNFNIKRCKYCNQYFIPTGRSDSEYCDRISKGETRPCNEIGAVKLHEASKADDKVYQAYLKAYRRMNSRARQKKISQTQFYEWSEKARTKRDKCNNGEITFYEYKKWLDKDKKR